MDMCFRFFKVLMLQVVFGAGPDAPSLTCRSPVHTSGAPLAWKAKVGSAPIASRPRLDAVCIPQRVREEESLVTVGYIPSIPEDDVY